jgi:hypothetical protein
MLALPVRAEVLSFRQIPFFITLNFGEEQRIASSGPLRYIARCIVNDGGEDKARIIATSTEDGWFEEDSSTTTFNAGDEVIAFVVGTITGTLFYNNDTDDGSSLTFTSATRGNHLSIDGETLGLGLNLGPPANVDCVFAGTATAIRGSVGND